MLDEREALALKKHAKPAKVSPRRFAEAVFAHPFDITQFYYPE